MQRVKCLLTLPLLALTLNCCGSVRSEPTDKPAQELTAGQSVTVTIRSHEKWNHTGVLLDRGVRYRFVAKGIWCDFYKPVTADGYDSLLFTPAENKLRGKDMNWFSLVGCVGENQDNVFLIGRKREFIAMDDGELTCFANDVSNMYWNNWGSVRLTVTRLDWP